MIINIYTSLNGVGLEQDANILKGVLNKHTCYVLDYIKRQKSFSRGNYAIHLEIPRYDEIEQNDINVLIPNPEWFDPKWLQKIKLFNFIYCKTQYTYDVFRRYHDNCIYTGFTSYDYYDETIKKDKIFFHLEGQSQFKNTDMIIEAYNLNKELPTCFAVSSRHKGIYNNLTFTERQEKESLRILLNGCLIHICPSMAEGFGHYINEARSTGAVILTTDKPPMNEFVNDSRLLIDSKRTRIHNLAPLFKSDILDIEKKIISIFAIDYDELIEIGKQNRKNFLELDAFFKNKIKELIK